MTTKQGRVHSYDDLTISVFHFHFTFQVSISTVSSCPLWVEVSVQPHSIGFTSCTISRVHAIVTCRDLQSDIG